MTKGLLTKKQEKSAYRLIHLARCWDDINKDKTPLPTAAACVEDINERRNIKRKMIETLSELVGWPAV